MGNAQLIFVLLLLLLVTSDNLVDADARRLFLLLMSSNIEKLDVLDDEFLRDVHDEYADELLIELFFCFFFFQLIKKILIFF